MKIHMRQSSNCSFVQSLNKEKTSTIAKKSTKKLSSIKFERKSKIKSRFINEDFLQKQLNQNDCSLNQVLNLNEKKTFNSTSTKSVSIDYIVSSQTLYLIIENLYQMQKTLFVKIKKNLETKKIVE